MTTDIETIPVYSATFEGEDQRFITPEEWSRIRWLEDRARKGKVNVTLLAEDFANALLLLMRENKMWRKAVDQANEDGFNEGYDACLTDHEGEDGFGDDGGYDPHSPLFEHGDDNPLFPAQAFFSDA